MNVEARFKAIVLGDENTGAEGQLPNVDDMQTPETGDNTNLLLWAGLMAMAGIVICTIKRRKTE